MLTQRYVIEFQERGNPNRYYSTDHTVHYPLPTAHSPQPTAQQQLLPHFIHILLTLTLLTLTLALNPCNNFTHITHVTHVHLTCASRTKGGGVTPACTQSMQSTTQDTRACGKSMRAFAPVRSHACVCVFRRRCALQLDMLPHCKQAAASATHKVRHTPRLCLPTLCTPTLCTSPQLPRPPHPTPCSRCN